MFCDSNCTRWYSQIINRAQARIFASDFYTETHHTIPNLLGGTKKKSNLVSLPGKEHFIAHQFLAKMVTGKEKKKIVYACKMMHGYGNSQQRYQITSRIYKYSKQKLTKEKQNS
jgi:hypothetical protein